MVVRCRCYPGQEIMMMGRMISVEVLSDDCNQNSDVTRRVVHMR